MELPVRLPHSHIVPDWIAEAIELNGWGLAPPAWDLYYLRHNGTRESTKPSRRQTIWIPTKRRASICQKTVRGSFEEELDGWYRDPSAWPADRSFKNFKP
jgi:hypothetical protein